VLDQKLLENINDYDAFSELSEKLSSYPKDELFNFLFPIAISCRGSYINGIAGYLLINLEPRHTRKCSELLNEIAHSKWDVSNREVPFYLITQFGKWNLEKEIKDYVASNKLTELDTRRVETIWYWASSPTVTLCEHLHYFEWQEVIEGEESSA
jgi:hypothetical protein